MIGTRQRIPGELMARGENVKFNSRGPFPVLTLSQWGGKKWTEDDREGMEDWCEGGMSFLYHL